MESKIIKTKEIIAEKLDFPRDVVLDIPKITIIGDNEITIENHKGVVIFDEEKMKINSNAGLITIYGNSFKILFMGGSTLTISGKFKSMMYENNV
ncbi:sporulation protein YqfC [Candidatus Clostridium radicumherbarum]|uniref:Sporulation protein YqfC n=1 Tax=Candidatus Clostridium radicumherbarum TaxID=3381662 RepID=A0ABW8TTG0_9CLOT